ncbi:MAG: hypothetical protein BMS9Abin11_1333 [Gammaproteobacteria bacterium]|nr:MAG: hypothetical protein BMS9Abin11_1333 [Gammaproteobacteria bacterium]
MKPNHLKQTGTFLMSTLTMALILFVLSAAAPQIVEARTTATTAAGCSGMTGKKKTRCSSCVWQGGTFIDEGDSTTCKTKDDTEDCTYGGDMQFCLLCWGGTGWNRAGATCTVYRTATKTSAGAIRTGTSLMKKVPLTSIPIRFVPPRLRAIRAAEIRKNKQRALMKKRGEVKDAKDRYANKKQKTAITKPTRPGVPMPTKPIRPGTPMKK